MSSSRARQDSNAFIPACSTLAEALTAYTAGTARVNHADRTGRIAAGMLADLVVLDRNPFGGPPREIHQTRVAATFVGGQAVYRA